jgi:choline dehydrogenase-like flavoprotein
MGAVTDRCGRVNDVAGLFVVDSSVFPAVPSVNPMVPTVQLAETITNRWLAEGLVAN